MTGGGLVILFIVLFIIAFFSIFGISALVVFTLLRRKSLADKLAYSFVITLLIPVLIVSISVITKSNFLFEFLYKNWWLLPLIFSILFIYSLVSWIVRQRRKGKKYLWFVFGIAGMFIIPIISLFIPRAMSGEAGLNMLIGVAVFVIIPFAFIAFFPLYLSGFLIGMIIGYFLDEGVAKTVKSKLWLILAAIGASYRGIYIGLFHRFEENFKDAPPVIGVTVNITLETILWAIFGAIIGWAITKFVFQKNEKQENS